MNPAFLPFIWVALALPVLLFLQRWIHRHLRGIALLLTGHAERSILLYALVLLPGVMLHELSHWLTAGLLGVRTGAVSLLPRLKKDKTLQLGYVEYYKDARLGPLRESLIGGAPLIFGTAVILIIGYRVFDLPALAANVQRGDIDGLLAAARLLWYTNDFFIWLYLLFAVSNAMMPSPSDVRAWPLFLGILGAAVAALLLMDLGDVVLQGITGPLSALFGYLALAFGLTIVVDIVFVLLLGVLELAISALRGARVRYE